MNDLKQNEQMELLRKLREQQPEVYDKLPAQEKMALGYYLASKDDAPTQPAPNKSTDEAMSTFERITLGYQTQNQKEKK